MPNNINKTFYDIQGPQRFHEGGFNYVHSEASGHSAHIRHSVGQCQPCIWHCHGVHGGGVIGSPLEPGIHLINISGNLLNACP